MIAPPEALPAAMPMVIGEVQVNVSAELTAGRRAAAFDRPVTG